MTLRPVRACDRTLIENLFNLYRNDLSLYCDDFPCIDEDGFFDKGIADEVLPFGDGVETYIILNNGHPAGLIMVTSEEYALEGCSRRFQELYLIRPERGKGLARAAAEQMLAAHPGRWCLSVYKNNHPARRFWDKLIAERGRLIYSVPGEEGMLDLVFDTCQDEDRPV